MKVKMKWGWGNLLVVLCVMASCAGCEEDDKEDLLSPNIEQESHEEEQHLTAEPVDTTADIGRDSINDFRQPPEWVNYMIPQGEHNNSLRGFDLFSGDTLEFRFVFDQTAAYQTTDPLNQADWNKLMGFSDCGSFHHSNSFRMVWRYTASDSVEIGEYRYGNGKREFSSVGSVAIGDTALARLTAEEGFYTLNLNNKQLQLPRACNTSSGRYWLYPYFGGDETAPHNVNLYVQHLKPRY